MGPVSSTSVGTKWHDLTSPGSEWGQYGHGHAGRGVGMLPVVGWHCVTPERIPAVSPCQAGREGGAEVGAFTWGCPGASGALARRQCCSFDVPLKRHCQRPAGTIRAEGWWGGVGRGVQHGCGHGGTPVPNGDGDGLRAPLNGRGDVGTPSSKGDGDGGSPERAQGHAHPFP